MEIIISANEKILSMTKDKKLTNDMSKRQFTDWLDAIAKVGKKDEPEIQKIQEIQV